MNKHIITLELILAIAAMTYSALTDNLFAMIVASYFAGHLINLLRKAER